MKDSCSAGATYDSMTGLKDRMSFFKDVNQKKINRERSHIVLVQLSQLMWVNRKYGVLVGDQLIRDIACYLKGLEPNYTAYRISNSWMVLVGAECDELCAATMVEQLQTRFEKTWQMTCGNQKYTIRAKAVFVHLFLEPEDTENSLLDKLNYALSVLTAEKNNTIILFNENLQQAMEHRKYVLEEVRHAVEHKTFQMYYQPIYSCKERKFTSAESLIRLFGRDGTFISPGEFIPMAEDNGLIDQISWIVLEKVCCFLGEHPDLPLHTISVNMTGQQVLDPTFVQRIETLLETCRLDGSRLRIEITERTVTEDFKEVKRVMEYLAGRGIRFYLDDFGTGYSNLSSMLSLPFEVVKFDQSLIRIMDDTSQGQKTIGLLAEIMHENSYVVVAEGIETQLQAEAAFEKDLDRIQGFFYAQPLPEAELPEFLAKACETNFH